MEKKTTTAVTQHEESEQVSFLQRKLVQKKVQLRQTRNTLSQARMKIKKMKAIIAYQRNRIVELYQQQSK